MLYKKLKISILGVEAQKHLTFQEGGTKEENITIQPSSY